jgi:hypothetical protein
LLLKWMMSLQKALTQICVPDSVFAKEAARTNGIRITRRSIQQYMINLTVNGINMVTIRQKRKECILLPRKQSLPMLVIP